MSDIRFNTWLHQSGTGGVYQDSTGRVGIGTSVPTSALDIQSGMIKIGSNTLSSSGVSTFTSVTATTVTSTTVNATSIVGVNTLGVTTAYVGSINGGPISGTRNRIINGDMRIAQRGTSLTITGASGLTQGYFIDRFIIDIGAAAGQLAGSQSTDVPTGQGFTNSLLCTVNTARTMGSTEYVYLRQNIEGLNFADAMYGTSNAVQYMLSFWVKSSLTGTFGLYYGSDLNARMSSGSYTIFQANTWEKKSVIITPDITSPSSWKTDNTLGLQVAWSLGCGSSYRANPGVWSGSLTLGATGQVDLIATSGATFYITGVQLEAGTVATPFERRSFGQELALCQRYFEIVNINGVTTFYDSVNVQHRGTLFWKVTKRVDPTTNTAAVTNYQPGGGSGTASCSNQRVGGCLLTSGSTNSTWVNQWINSDSVIQVSAEL
jgi:hypothetical protein